MTTPTEPSEAPARPCPACEAPRVGNRRGRCRVCNSFTQRVKRRAAVLLAERYPDDAAALREEVEGVEYAALLGAPAHPDPIGPTPTPTPYKPRPKQAAAPATSAPAAPTASQRTYTQEPVDNAASAPQDRPTTAPASADTYESSPLAVNSTPAEPSERPQRAPSTAGRSRRRARRSTLGRR